MSVEGALARWRSEREVFGGSFSEADKDARSRARTLWI